MTIPALPSLDRTSPTFRTDLDTFFLTQLPATVTALNSELTRIDGILPAGYVATSTTSLAIAASGTVTLTTQTGKGFAPGQFVVISVTADPATQMGGWVTAYDFTTGALSVSVSQSAGSGTYAAWTVAISAAAASPYYVGDIALTNRTLTAPTWLPADGAIYSQSSYAALYAEIGLLAPDPVKMPSATMVAYGFNDSADYAPNRLRSINGMLFLSSVSSPSASTRYYTSANDGVTWTTRTAPFSTTNIKGIFWFNNKYWMHTTDASTLYESTDLTTWSVRALPANASIGSNISNLGVFAGLLILMPDTNTTTYYTSPDGVNWTTRTLPATSGGAIFFDQNVAATSTTLTYLPTASGMVSPWTTKPYYTSTDGINWTTRSLNLAPASWGLSADAVILVRANAAGNEVVVFVSGTNTNQFLNRFVSKDHGSTFTLVTVPLAVPAADGNVANDPSGFIWAGGYCYQFCTMVASTIYWIVPRWSQDMVNWYAFATKNEGPWDSGWSMPQAFAFHNGKLFFPAKTSDSAPSYTFVYSINLMPYDIATQFITPTVAGANGVTAYIKT